MLQRELFKGIEHWTSSAPSAAESSFPFIWSSAQSIQSAFESIIHSTLTTNFTAPEFLFSHLWFLVHCGRCCFSSTPYLIKMLFRVNTLSCDGWSQFLHIWRLSGLIRFTILSVLPLLFWGFWGFLGFVWGIFSISILLLLCFMFASDLVIFIEEISIKTLHSFWDVCENSDIPEFKIRQIISIYYHIVFACTKVKNFLWQVEGNEPSHKCLHVI